MMKTIVIVYDTGSVEISLISHQKLFTDLEYRFNGTQDTITLSVAGRQEVLDSLLENRRLDYELCKYDGYLKSKEKIEHSIAVLELLIQILPQATSCYWLWIKNLHNIQDYQMTAKLRTYLWNSSCKPLYLKKNKLNITNDGIEKFVDYLERRLSIIPVMKNGTPLKDSSYALYLYHSIKEWYEDFLYDLDSEKNISKILDYFADYDIPHLKLLDDGETKIIYPQLMYWICKATPSTEFCVLDSDWDLVRPSRDSPWELINNFHLSMDKRISGIIASDDALVNQTMVNEDEDVRMDVILRSVLYDTPLSDPCDVKIINRCASGACSGKVDHLSQAAFMIMLRQWLNVIAHHPRSEWKSLTLQWRSCSAVDNYIKQCVSWISCKLHDSDQHQAFAIFAHELGYWSSKMCHKTKHECLNTYPQSASTYELDEHMFTYHCGERY